MKTPNSHINTAKLTSKISNGISWFVAWFIVFPMMVMYGVLTILVGKVTEHKDIAKTRGISEQSKIVPKNTREHRNNFGYPEINKR